MNTVGVERWRAWEPGVDEGTSRRKGTAVRERGAPQVSLQVCPKFSLTVHTLVCLPSASCSQVTLPCGTLDHDVLRERSVH